MQASGGVIKPPSVGEGRVIEPSQANSDNMPTAPAIPSQPNAPTGSHGLTGSQRTQMESLLQGARSEAEAGRAAECNHQLEQARAIPQMGPG